MAKIGLIQVDNRGRLTLEERWDMLYRLGESCLTAGADLLFFPEAFQYLSNRPESADRDWVGPKAAQWKARCSALAKKYGAYVVPWDYEATEDGNVYNTSYILGRDGNELGRFRKVHLTYGEQFDGFANGDSYPVFDLDIGKVGIMICFDNYWPETARILALNGAGLILYPLYGDTLTPQWEIKFRARAIDNSVYVASSQLDDKYRIAYTGLVNPLGDVVARLDSAPSWTVVEAELGRRVVTATGGGAKREYLVDYLAKCRRPETYGALTEPVAAKPWEEIFLDE